MVQSSQTLKKLLQSIDGRGYKAYKSIRGCYAMDPFRLSIDHVQGDPFAAPSRVSLLITTEEAEIPAVLLERKIRRLALGDFLSRAFRAAVQEQVKGRRGTGKSGLIAMDGGGQNVLERNSVVVSEDEIEARCSIGLPASGRRILGRQAEELIFHDLKNVAEASLLVPHLDSDRLFQHIRTVEDQEALRCQLEERKLVAFVGNDSILPRRSGVDDRPALPTPGQPVVSFTAPPELEVELDRPHHGPIRGMGVPEGVTLIVGGGFHGKSTLLRALERGIYNQVPGDGREWVVTIDSAVKIRAEDGRSIEKVNISPFIGDLPFGRKTRSFSTQNASGSVSQAANIMEALEIGSRLLLIDEDTSATNFMIRDGRMQELVVKSQEPITPFVDKVQLLLHEHGVSTILVMGGSGDYLGVSDTVLLMDEYRPHQVTARARAVIQSAAGWRRSEGGSHFGSLPGRCPLPSGFDASRGKRDVRIDARGTRTILFGTTEIDLSALEQIVDDSQTRAIGEAIHFFARHIASRGLSLREGLLQLEDILESKGLDALSPFKTGNLARPRIFELAFAMNRMRTLKVS